MNCRMRQTRLAVVAASILAVSAALAVSPQPAAAKERLKIRAHGMLPTRAFLPDGATLVAWGPGRIELWDTRTGKLKHQIEQMDEILDDVAVSPDGKTLAMVYDEAFAGAAMGAPRSVVKLRDTATGRVKRVLQPPGFTVEGLLAPGLGRCLAFSSDGKTLAAAGALVRGQPGQPMIGANLGPPAILVWDAASGKQLATLTGLKDSVHGLVFSPDAKTLAAAGYDSVRLWDAATGKTTYTMSQPFPCFALAFLPDGKTLVCCVEDLRPDGGSQIALVFWDVETGKRQKTVTLAHFVNSVSVAFSADVKTVAAVEEPNMIHLCDVQTGARRATLEAELVGQIQFLAFSPDGKTLAAACNDRTIRLWDVNLPGEKTPPEAVAQPAPQPGPKAEPGPAVRPPAGPETTPEMRTWTSADGQYTVEAAFDRRSGATVFLHAKDGRRLQVKLDALSAADRQHVEKVEQERAAAAAQEIPSEREAVKRLKELGAKVSLRRGRAASVDLSSKQFTDADMPMLALLTQLDSLDLSATQITDEGLKHLAGLEKLATLDLAGTKVTDEGMTHLQGLTALRNFRYKGTEVTFDGVQKIEQFRQHGPSSTDRSIVWNFRAFPARGKAVVEMTGVTLRLEDIGAPGQPMFGQLPVSGAMSVGGGSATGMGGTSLSIDQEYANGIADFSITDGRNRHDLKFLNAGALLLLDDGQVLTVENKPTLTIGPKGARLASR